MFSKDKLRKLVAVSIVATALTTGVGLTNISAKGWGSSCTASKTITTPIGFYILWTGVNATLQGVPSGSNWTVTSIDYNMGSPWWQVILPPGPLLPWLEGTGSSNNINITSPVSRISPDSLGWGGTWNFTNFTASTNSVVKAQMIPDISGAPDPSCVISFNIG